MLTAVAGRLSMLEPWTRLLVSNIMIPEIAYLGVLDDEAIELDVAALEIAALDHPDVELANYFDTLGIIAEELLARGSQVTGAAHQARMLADILADEYSFRGDTETYDDPANADVISVIDRRRGMPVALSILYVGLARRAGWSAYALNTPGHVLVSVVEDRTVLIDPFNSGAFVGAEQLAALLSGALGRDAVALPEHLTPLSNRGILVRLLMNQSTRAERSGQSERALSVLQRITTIAPSYSEGWWERSRLELIQGEVQAARASLSAMLETTRDPSLRSHINAALDSLAVPK